MSAKFIGYLKLVESDEGCLKVSNASNFFFLDIIKQLIYCGTSHFWELCIHRRWLRNTSIEEVGEITKLTHDRKGGLTNIKKTLTY